MVGWCFGERGTWRWARGARRHVDADRRVLAQAGERVLDACPDEPLGLLRRLELLPRVDTPLLVRVGQLGVGHEARGEEEAAAHGVARGALLGRVLERLDAQEDAVAACRAEPPMVGAQSPDEVHQLWRGRRWADAAGADAGGAGAGGGDAKRSDTTRSITGGCRRRQPDKSHGVDRSALAGCRASCRVFFEMHQARGISFTCDLRTQGG